MCGRAILGIGLESLTEILQEVFHVDHVELTGYEPRYNIAPGQPVLSIINDGQSNRAGYMKWGFIPSYAQSPKEGYKHMNTRSESIEKTAVFKDAFYNRRCLVLADSFYEWHKTSPSKTPYRIQIKDQPLMPMAGLWSRYRSKTGEILYTCSVVTTRSNDLMKQIHHRMPAILKPDTVGIWLNPSIEDQDLLKSLLKPYETSQMTMYPVSKLVNSTSLDSIELIEPA